MTAVLAPPVSRTKSESPKDSERPQPPHKAPHSQKPPRSRRWKPRAVRVAVFAALLLAWWAVARFAGINPVVLPSPGSVAQDLIDSNICRAPSEGSVRADCGVQGYFLWQHLLATLQRIGAGLLVGTIAGTALGCVLGLSHTVRSIVEPYLAFLRALPPLGYIGLLIVWFGIGDLSKGVLLFLAAFPVVVAATLQGVVGIRKDWVLAARTLGASKWDVARRVIIPGALPEIIGGIRLATALCWSAIVAAEMNDGIPGIGELAYVSGTQLDTSLTIACIIVIGATALLIDQTLLRVERAFAPWKARQ